MLVSATVELLPDLGLAFTPLQYPSQWLRLLPFILSAFCFLVEGILLDGFFRGEELEERYSSSRHHVGCRAVKVCLGNIGDIVIQHALPTAITSQPASLAS